MSRVPLGVVVGGGVLLLVIICVQVMTSNMAVLSAPLAMPTLAATNTFVPPKATPIVAAVSSNASTTCPITRPPNPVFVPPSPWPAEPVGGEFWIGTAELWTAVSPSGTWKGLPRNPTGYTQKIFVWKPNYSIQAEQQPKLTITGERLDAAAPSYVTSGGTNACHPDFGGCVMLLGINLPSLGCWKLTVEHAGHELSFVVWVAQ
jgi:hypothetical protein